VKRISHRRNIKKMLLKKERPKKQESHSSLEMIQYRPIPSNDQLSATVDLKKFGQNANRVPPLFAQIKGTVQPFDSPDKARA